VATQYASAPCKLTISSYLFARWHLFRHVGYLRHQEQVDLCSFDLESGILWGRRHNNTNKAKKEQTTSTDRNQQNQQSSLNSSSSYNHQGQILLKLLVIFYDKTKTLRSTTNLNTQRRQTLQS